MPGLNGTGPAGAGSMTGRGLGPCGSGEGIPAKEFYGRGMGHPLGARFGRGMGHPLGARFGRGMGCGRGMGFGGGFGPGYGYFRNAGAPLDEETRKSLLQEQRNFLKARLKTIDKQLETL